MATVHAQHAPSRESLLALLTPHESAADLLARGTRESLPTGVELLDAQLTLRPGVVLELAGPHGSGKSEVLLHMAVRCLLHGRTPTAAPHTNAPPSVTPDTGAPVVYIDLDAKFDMVHMVKALKHAVTQVVSADAAGMPRQQTQAWSNDLGNTLFDAALSRFTLFSCHTSADALAALVAALRILDQPGWRDRPKLLLIDNVAAFHYQDRAARAWQSQSHTPQPGPAHTTDSHAAASSTSAPAPAGGARSPHPPHPQPHAPVPAGPPLSLPHVHAALAALIARAGRHGRACVATTKCAPVWQEGGRLLARENMTVAWQAIVTHRLLLLAQPPHVVWRGNAHATCTRLLVQWGPSPGGVSAGEQQQEAHALLVSDVRLATEW
ncbi:hypothetical protein FOA52_010984 [Chlamydomonas sp. UWO 241]|nr:hypothetical protein FOA52_010984 [Chlamydomonas sp. UWO 241]